jgi:hypothetical protein
MNHTELVNRAEKWLKNTLHCRVVFTELVAYTLSGETPDAIGWVHQRSILVECKCSLSDFRADQKKRSRQLNMPALGSWRFYLTPPDLLSKNIIPFGWGLYEVYGKQVRYRYGEKYTNGGLPPFQSDQDSEKAMLLSALSRIHNKPPDADTKSREIQG